MTRKYQIAPLTKMDNTKTLLELAKGVQVNRAKRHVEASIDEMELVVAWAKGEITTKQVTVVMRQAGFGNTGGNALYRMASVFRDAVHAGYLIENPKYTTKE